MQMANAVQSAVSWSAFSLVWAYPLAFLVLVMPLRLRVSPLALLKPFPLAIVMLTAARLVYVQTDTFATLALPVIAAAMTLFLTNPNRARVL